jgi:hypothetical protein
MKGQVAKTLQGRSLVNRKKRKNKRIKNRLTKRLKENQIEKINLIRL